MLNIEIIRRKIIAGRYELTQHAKDEAASDSLDTEDIENIVMTGIVIKKLEHDPRGVRYIIAGAAQNKEEAEVVCRLLPSGKLRIITVYLK